MSPDQRMTRTLQDKMPGYAECQTLAQSGTFYGCSIESMSSDELLAIIGYLVKKEERDRQRKIDYIHSSGVSFPTGGITPRSYTR